MYNKGWVVRVSEKLFIFLQEQQELYFQLDTCDASVIKSNMLYLEGVFSVNEGSYDQI